MRLINRPLALVLAAAVAVAGIVVIADVIAFAVHASPVIAHWPTWYRWAARTRWYALVIKVWTIVLIVAGIVVLALELKPPRVTRLKLLSDQTATDAAVTAAAWPGPCAQRHWTSTASPRQPSPSAVGAPG